jgi:hypothetical protein
MRLRALTFAGYPSGKTSFAELLSTVPQPQMNDLLEVTSLITEQVRAPVPNRFISVIVTGHSDRQDRADFDCNQRRASEIQAARDRAVSAWEWIKAEVATELGADAAQAGEWWETSPQMTWGLVYAAAGMLQHDPPGGEDERSQNRRVVILTSVFNPQ